jgi:cytochrome d ubiquinol oxidase subunit II
LRGLGIEFRHQVNHPMWRTFWDAVFSLSSGLLAIFFGAALGNVVRGVPLGSDGYFFEPLWTTFTVVPNAGILDWFTLLMGLIAFFTLTVHGANYLSLRTGGKVRNRSRTIARAAWWGTLLSSILGLIATFFIRPETSRNYSEHPWGYVFPLCGFLSLGAIYFYRQQKKDIGAFLSSGAFIGSMLASTAFGLFPNLLPSSIDPNQALTIHNSAASEYGLRVGIVWWVIGIVLAMGYFVYLYRSFRGRVKLHPEESGY